MRRETLAPGAVFQSRYEILSLLRESSLASVYKARQLATGQAIVLKLMRLRRGGDPGDLARRYGVRLLREMRYCARLHHPNIVRLIDAGEADGGQLYTVYDFVPGPNLAELLSEQGALEPEEARCLMLQVLDALACAHRQGVVHGDLRPSHVMVVSTGARRNALVLDFGVGAVAAARLGGEARAPAPGDDLQGAYVYAAPEQLRGFAPTACSDLYSWGIVFLECLTRRRAVAGAAAAAGAAQEAGPLPIRIPRVLLGHPLGAILRRATLADVAARAVTASDLLRELDACEIDGLRREDLSQPVEAASEVGLAEAGGTARSGAGAPAVQQGERPARGALAGGDSGTARREGEGDAEAAPGGGPVASSARVAPEMLGNGARPAAEPRAIDAGAFEAERRPITAVCCSLTFTGSGLASLDIEDADELFAQMEGICVEVARRHRGRLGGALGDQVLLCFGFPGALEDDARRAARAALEISAAIQARSARLTAERGMALESRIGVHSGVVLVRKEQGQIPLLGVTLQRAVRLSASAANGTIVVSADTHRSLRDRFALEETSARTPTGEVDHGTVHQLRAELPFTTMDETSSDEVPRPMFGRAQELELLIQRWGEARRGAGQSVLVMGMEGIGKTRLMLELVRSLRHEAPVCRECRCLSDRSLNALYPVVDLLERRLERGADEPAMSKLKRLEALLSRYHFDTADAVPLLASLLSIPLEPPYAWPKDAPHRQKERTFHVLLSLIFEEADEHPVLFIIEDVHWADPLTLEWLGKLVAEVPSTRVMAVLTARPELSLPWPASSLLQMQIPLDLLDRAPVEQIVAQITGGRPLPEAELEQIVQRADGVPLFVEELTRMVLESGVLREEGGRYVLSERLPHMAIPTTLTGFLMARLDRLGSAKQTAQLAAALGREFSQEVLAAVSVQGHAVQEDLDRLQAADLIHSRQRARRPIYTFKHSLIRDAAYGLLPHRARQEVNARIARTLEERFPEIVERRPELLAHHHAEAGQKARAIVYAERAAELALRHPASGADEREVVTHLHEALGWLGAIPDDRERALTEMRLNNLLILTLLDRRGYTAPELIVAVRRCEELSEALGDSPRMASTLWATFIYHHQRSHRREARLLAERFVSMAERSNDINQLVWSLPLLGQCLWIEGHLPVARKHLERALALYDHEEHRQHAFLYGVDSRTLAEITLVPVLYLMGYPARALALGEAALSRAYEIDHPHSIWLASLYLLVAHHYGGERAKIAEESRRLDGRNDPHRSAYHEYFVMLRCWAEGDLERLIQTETLRGASFLIGMTYYPSLAAELEAERSRHGAAIERLDECLKFAENTGEMYYAPELYRLKAESLLACALSSPRAEECLRRAIQLARAQGARLPELRSVLALCRFLLQQERREEARDLLRGLGGWPAEVVAMPGFSEAQMLCRELSC